MQTLKIDLEIPRVQVGMFNLSSAITGLDAALRPHLDGEATEGPGTTIYPLAVREGVGISLPLTVPLLGRQEVTLDHRDGLLILGVPSMARNYVEPLVASRTHGPIGCSGGMVTFPLRLKAGDTTSVPLGPVGSIAIRVRA